MTDEEVYQRIIWSADVPDVETLETVLRKIGLPIVVKLDRDFHRANDSQPFSEASALLTELGFKEFNDAKLVEIPSKLEQLARTEIRMTQPWMLNCMAGSISTLLATAEKRDTIDGLKRFADVCGENDVRASR